MHESNTQEVAMKKLAMMLLVMFVPMMGHAEGLAVSGKVGTLGMGLELTQGYSDALSARLGFNAFNFATNSTKGTVNYDANLQLQTISALADWYPMHGAFRTTGGLFYNKNKLSLNAIPTAGTTNYAINGANYALNSLQGNVTFNSVAPYLGLGWGNPTGQGKGWGLTSDLGILFQGSPNVTLAQTGGNAAAQAAVNQEQVRLQNSLSNFKLYPVASVGISYQW